MCTGSDKAAPNPSECHHRSFWLWKADMSQCISAVRSTDIRPSQSASLTGAWNSLFSSSSDPQVSWQKPMSPGAVNTLSSNTSAAAMAAAVHQSAAFAALFDDMVSSQSGEYFLANTPTLPQPSGQSSAASLCDSATSFSFKTPRHERTEPLVAHQNKEAQPGIGHAAQVPGPFMDSLLTASGQQDLAATLKYWQSSKQALTQSQDGQPSASQQQLQPVKQPTQFPLPQHQQETVFWGQPVAASTDLHQHAAVAAKSDLIRYSASGEKLGCKSISGTKQQSNNDQQPNVKVRRHSRVRKHEVHQGTSMFQLRLFVTRIAKRQQMHLRHAVIASTLPSM